MTLEVRQNALENEMNAAKDTIWRLTNRIYNLEKEVGLLKNFIQKATKSPSPSGPPVSAKLAEITRRKQTLTGFRNIQKKDLKSVKVNAEPSLRSQSKGDSSDNTPVENPSRIIIKNEPVSEDEMPSNVENVIHHSLQGRDFKHGLKRHSNITSLEGKRMKVHQSDQSNSSDSEGSSTETSDVKDADFVPTGSSLSKVRNSSVRLGRPKCPTWKYFKRIKLPANKGNCRFLAVCKICKIEVSGRADRLKPHITKCLAKYIARGKKIPGIGSGHVTKKVIPKRKPVQVIQSAPSTASDFNRTFTRGRKKAHQVWQYYTETVSDSVDNGGERFMAICKNCGQEVSRKTDRLQGHLKRCMGIEFVGSHEIRVNCKKETYEYDETKSAAALTNVRITSSQSVAVNQSQIPSASGSTSEDSENAISSVVPAAPIDTLMKRTQENQKSQVHLQELEEPQDNHFNINAEENQCQPNSIGETRTS